MRRTLFALLVLLSTACRAADEGTACYRDQDCRGGSCVYAGCPGMCLPYRTQGESCGSAVQFGGSCSINGVPVACTPLWGDCDPASGLVCDPIGHVCEPTTDASAATVGAGASCSLFGPVCDPGLYCAGPFPNAGTCEPLVGAGGNCSIDNPGCATGLVCAGDGPSVDAGVCHSPAPVGGSCVTPTDAGTGVSGCEPSLVCVAGECQQPPATGPCLNGACQVDTSFCDPTTDTCQPLRADGTSCPVPDSDPIQCKSHWCDLTGHCGTAICPSPGE